MRGVIVVMMVVCELRMVTIVVMVLVIMVVKTVRETFVAFGMEMVTMVMAGNSG